LVNAILIGLVCVIPLPAYLLGAWAQRKAHACPRLPPEWGGFCTLREVWTAPGRTAPEVVATRRVYLRQIPVPELQEPVYDVLDVRDLPIGHDQPPPGYAACTRHDGHDGPCAHPEAE
jgi:hypothetical protein